VRSKCRLSLEIEWSVHRHCGVMIPVTPLNVVAEASDFSRRAPLLPVYREEPRISTVSDVRYFKGVIALTIDCISNAKR